jgi:O-antigen ligase
LVFIIALTIVGLGITRSRAGIGVAAVCVPTVILLAAFSRSWVAGLVTLGILAALVIAPLAVLGPAEVRGLIAEKAGMWLNPFEEDIRFLGRQSTWNMIGDFPMFGTGLGTYSSVYPAYKVRGPMLYFAHCDSLQWFAETGLVGLVLAAAVLVTAVWTAVAGWFRIKEPFLRRLLLGTALACVAFLAHGLVDFPLAIPGVAVIFVALAASTLVIASRSGSGRQEEGDFTF